MVPIPSFAYGFWLRAEDGAEYTPAWQPFWDPSREVAGESSMQPRSQVVLEEIEDAEVEEAETGMRGGGVRCLGHERSEQELTMHAWEGETSVVVQLEDEVTTKGGDNVHITDTGEKEVGGGSVNSKGSQDMMCEGDKWEAACNFMLATGENITKNHLSAEEDKGMDTLSVERARDGEIFYNFNSGGELLDMGPEFWSIGPSKEEHRDKGKAVDLSGGLGFEMGLKKRGRVDLRGAGEKVRVYERKKSKKELISEGRKIEGFGGEDGNVTDSGATLLCRGSPARINETLDLELPRVGRPSDGSGTHRVGEGSDAQSGWSY